MHLNRYSPRTEAAYVDWIKRYIRFHGIRHPQEMGAEEVKAFLSHLAIQMNVAASTQNQAFSALERDRGEVRQTGGDHADEKLCQEIKRAVRSLENIQVSNLMNLLGQVN